MNTQQSHKKILEEMSKHEPNCPQSEDIREDCTCPQQSTVEERLSNLLHEFQREFNQKDIKFNGPGPLERRAIKNRYVEEIKSEIQLAEQKVMEELLERIKTMISPGQLKYIKEIVEQDYQP